ncbi:hypothetical protein LH464_09960 [Neorhizobium sp. T786]|uniref:hypothetical protein n=1 Tax=Pseudorhizobium xiangyangii TaxID=2883104 RepID=UPI001CFFB1CC|nr:hypothetical protein [Neorhizobium xiangyangii]MCB5202798.1 hypothetical protein [Neorhizobium xiangyangii]
MRLKQDAMRWGIFNRQDIDVMRDAFLLALEDGTAFDVAEDGEMLGRAIIRLYKMGLSDPQKLADVAALMTSSRLFRAETSHRCRSEEAVLMK